MSSRFAAKAIAISSVRVWSLGVFLLCVAAVIATTSEADEEEGIDLGIRQTLDGSPFGVSNQQIQEALKERGEYFETEVLDVLKPEQVERCKDVDENCLMWSLDEECTENEDFMDKHCALSCQVCDKVLPDEELCHYLPSGPDVWVAGDLNQMFRRIVDDPFYQQNYDLQILSSPDSSSGSDDDDEEDYEKPWVIVLDNFLTSEEAERLIELGALEGYDISTMAGREDEDEDRWRTSTNSWCQEKCYEDEIYQNISRRILEMTRIPSDYAEDMQMLRYEPGQL